jgi:hypothetical protein
MLWLRSSRFSPRPPVRRRTGGSPLWPRCRVATGRARLPLSPHYNPRLTSCEQPRNFLRLTHLFLASFADVVSTAVSLALSWPASCEEFWTDGPARCCIRHTHSRQATLHPTPHHVSASHAGLHCAVALLLALVQPPRRRRPPQEEGRRPHAIADRPSSWRTRTPVSRDGARTPSNSPRLGIGGHHQRRHRCARDGFLGPPSEKVVLTRILRHPNI